MRKKVWCLFLSFVLASPSGSAKPSESDFSTLKQSFEIFRKAVTVGDVLEFLSLSVPVESVRAIGKELSAVGVQLNNQLPNISISEKGQINSPVFKGRIQILKNSNRLSFSVDGKSWSLNEKNRIEDQLNNLRRLLSAGKFSLLRLALDLAHADDLSSGDHAKRAGLWTLAAIVGALASNPIGAALGAIGVEAAFPLVLIVGVGFLFYSFYKIAKHSYGAATAPSNAQLNSRVEMKCEGQVLSVTIGKRRLNFSSANMTAEDEKDVQEALTAQGRGISIDEIKNSATQIEKFCGQKGANEALQKFASTMVNSKPPIDEKQPGRN